MSIKQTIVLPVTGLDVGQEAPNVILHEGNCYARTGKKALVDTTWASVSAVYDDCQLCEDRDVTPTPTASPTPTPTPTASATPTPTPTASPTPTPTPSPTASPTPSPTPTVTPTPTPTVTSRNNIVYGDVIEVEPCDNVGTGQPNIFVRHDYAETITNVTSGTYVRIFQDASAPGYPSIHNEYARFVGWSDISPSQVSHYINRDITFDNCSYDELILTYCIQDQPTVTVGSSTYNINGEYVYSYLNTGHDSGTEFPGNPVYINQDDTDVTLNSSGFVDSTTNSLVYSVTAAPLSGVNPIDWAKFEYIYG